MSEYATGPNLCSVEGCSNRTRYKEYCLKHRYRVRKYGSPHITVQKPPGELRKWLENHARWPEQHECLLWPFGRDRNGYPVAGATKGHSLMCEIAHGPKPHGKSLAAHSCDVRHCVNPNHLRWATYKENAADAVSRGRLRKGERVNTAKLTPDAVREIRNAPRGYGKTKALAQRFGVAVGTINHIWAGKGWRHLA